MRVIPACGGVVSFVSLIILAVGMATDHWIDFQRATALNPTVTNPATSLASLNPGVSPAVDYNVRNYGLWVGCFLEKSPAQQVSCTYIGSHCFANVCWRRYTTKKPSISKESCLDSRVVPLTNCIAYQFVRAFICLAILIMIIGTSAQLMSLLTSNRTLAAVAGVVVFIAGILTMIGFSIFYGQEFASNGISGIGSMGYSLVLVIVAWPCMLVSGILSCCAASMGIQETEKSNYSASNF
jgi:PMP-22/EMP/MP20/Claudin tight junction